jgi:hypothetical protein
MKLVLAADTPKGLTKEQIQKKIDTLRKKKIQIIDLAAEGMISKADLKEQNDVYTQQIEQLSIKLNEVQNKAIEANGQAKQIEQYIERIKQTDHIETDDDLLLGEVLKKAVVYNEGQIDIYLNIVPFGIKICYKTSGKMDFFNVEVESAEVIGSDVQL